MVCINNCEIEEIGLRFIQHFNSYELRMSTKDFGISIPLNRLNEFVKLFPDINWEDGYMFHKLKGHYLRYVTDESGMKIVELKHIVKDISYEV